MAQEVIEQSNSEKNVELENATELSDQTEGMKTVSEVWQFAHKLLEIAYEPMLVLDTDYRVISANHSFYETFKLNPGDTEGRLIYELSNGQWDIPELHEFLEDTLPKGDIVFNFKVDHEFEGIGQLSLAFSGQRVIMQTTGVRMIVLAIKDITEQSKVTENAEESASYIKETLESTDDGILVSDTENNIKVFNQRVVKLFGIPESVISSGDFKKVFEFIIEQLSDPERYSAIAEELNENPEAESFDIVETKNKVILEYYSKPQRLGEEIVGRIWSFRDITTRKWAERALKITYISFVNILESSRDGIIVVDKNGSLCFYNHAAEKMFSGKVDDRINKRLSFPIKTNEIEEVEIMRLDGGLGVAEMRIVETEWEGKSAYLAMLRDITLHLHTEIELKKHQEHLEEEVKQRTNELIQAEKMVALGQLVAGVAHEVNNPLAFIRSNTEYMTDILLDLKELFKKNKISSNNLKELEKLVNINIEGINRISKITRALRRFVKPGSEDKSFGDLNQGIKDTLLIVGNRLKHRIEIHEEYGELPNVLCNIEQLNQVFMNVILNSSEAMESGNIHIKTWVKDGNINIEFQDDGNGISQEDINKIFDPFFTTKKDGTGLGLSLSYRIIQDHNGTIKVDSEEDKGTKVKIELPEVCEND